MTYVLVYRGVKAMHFYSAVKRTRSGSCVGFTLELILGLKRAQVGGDAIRGLGACEGHARGLGAYRPACLVL